MPRVFCSGNPHQALVTILEHAQTLCCVVPLIEKNRLATSLLLSNDAGRGIGYFDQNNWSDQVAEGVLRVGCDNHGVSMGQSRIRSSPCTSCCSKKNRMNVGVFPQISSNLDEGRLKPKRHKTHGPHGVSSVLHPPSLYLQSYFNHAMGDQTIPPPARLP